MKPERFGLAIAPGLVVDNDGIHPVAAESGRVFLSSGTNRIRLEWFQWFGELGLNLDYEGGNSAPANPQLGAFKNADRRDHWAHKLATGLDYRYYEGTWNCCRTCRSCNR